MSQRFNCFSKVVFDYIHIYLSIIEKLLLQQRAVLLYVKYIIFDYLCEFVVVVCCVEK